MRYYKITLSSGDPVRIREDELEFTAEMIGKRHPAIVTSGGVFNAAFYVSITYDKKYMEELSEQARYQDAKKTLELQEAGRVSRFAKLLGPKMAMLTAPERTAAIEEADKKH